MKPEDVERLPEVKQAAKVLKELEKCGLKEPSIAGGWIAALLTDANPTDIDVIYVGPVHYEEAQQCLASILNKFSIDAANWDIKGIWNAEIAWKTKTVAQALLGYYVSSINSIYLDSGGKLNDPSGYGFGDSQSKILRINSFNNIVHEPVTVSRKVFVCIQGIRRIAQLGWVANADSLEQIKEGIGYWKELVDSEKDRFAQRAQSKYLPYKDTYVKYGWGFLFDS